MYYVPTDLHTWIGTYTHVIGTYTHVIGTYKHVIGWGTHRGESRGS